MKNILNVIVFSIIFFNSIDLSAQNTIQSKIDSMVKEIPNQKEDANKVRLLGTIAQFYSTRNPDEGLKYGNQSRELAGKLNWKNGVAWSYTMLALNFFPKTDFTNALICDSIAQKIYEETGNKNGSASVYYQAGKIYASKGDNFKALDYFLQGLKIYESIGIKPNIGGGNMYVGNIYNQLGNYSTAIEYYFKAYKIYEEIGYQEGISNVCGNIGIIYFTQNDYDKALEYDLKCLKIGEEMGNKQLIATICVNIGNVYKRQGILNLALEYMFRSLKLENELGNKYESAVIVHNIGEVYAAQRNYTAGLAYYFKSLKLNKEIGNNIGEGLNYTSAGIALRDIVLDSFETKIKKYSTNPGDDTYLPDSLMPKGRIAVLRKSVEYLEKAKQKWEETGNLDHLQLTYFAISQTDSLLGDFKAAYLAHLNYSNIKDSVFSENSNKKIIQNGMQYEFEKKEAVAKVEQEKKDFIANRQRWYLIAGLGLLGCIVVIIFRNYKNQQKSNTLLSKTNSLLTTEKKRSDDLLHEVTLKNRELTDNINYAQRIQSAILPDIQLIYKALEKSFILYLPKDIVSGDFYAFAERHDKVIIIAADCTGHGVSGAFMSMIGSALINQIINEQGIDEPGEILNELNAGIIEALRQTDSETAITDGMDVTVCAFDLKKLQLEYAGANRPLWLIRNGTLETYKPDKYPIGGLQAAHDRKFKNNVVELRKNDTIYIFSDGYADQFGGEKGKKMMTSRFKDELISIQPLDLRAQEEHLKTFLDQWKGANEQVDDVLVIGVRV